jgi:hypothetical protein
MDLIVVVDILLDFGYVELRVRYVFSVEDSEEVCVERVETQ